MIDLDALNDEQREAVTHGEGPLLVISAAGSGKTRVLVHRAAWLLEQDVRPESVMLCTFTKKAAAEMTDRIGGLVGTATAARLRSGTMHSLFLRILRAEGWPWEDFEILDETLQKRMVRGIFSEPRPDDLAEALAAISLWKNELVPAPALGSNVFEWAETLGIDSIGDRDIYRLGVVYQRYEDAKRSQQKLDFDDMLVETVRLFEARPEVLESYQEAIQWLLVDEAQDTSTAQWRALELLAGLGGGDSAEGAPAVSSPRNITCVADWRQSIYSWRGARPEFILDFADRFPGGHVVSLPKNYRSTPPIVTAANDLIRHAGRELEDMVPVREGGAQPVFRVEESPDDEAHAVALRIIDLTQIEGHKGGEIAILYRVNSYSRAFEETLASYKIPYTILGSKGFFGRREITDVLAYLRLALDHDDEESLRRIVNRPTRYLGKVYADAVAEFSRGSGRTLLQSLEDPPLNSRQAVQAERFADDMASVVQAVSEGGPAAAIRLVRADIGYDVWLLREEGSGRSDENRLENLDELGAVAARFRTSEDLLRFVDMQLAQSSSDSPDPNKVQMMTVHRSKGLEWPIVFVVGASEGLLPHRRCLEADALQEERRLAYVAMTRARDELNVSSVLEWQGRSMTPSRFAIEAGLGSFPAVNGSLAAIGEEA